MTRQKEIDERRAEDECWSIGQELLAKLRNNIEDFTLLEAYRRKYKEWQELRKASS